MLKKVLDFFYGVNKASKRFLEQYPNDTIVVADASKGVRTEGEQDIKRNANWVVAQRAVLILSNKRLKCGKWEIPLDKIEKASLVKVSSLLSSATVLKITTKNEEHYQFGMQANDAWIH